MSYFLKEYFVFFILFITVINADESPGFFLKISKNVPRIGRRSDNNKELDEYYFTKGIKTVPRIGRRDHYVDSNLHEEDIPSWYKFLRPSRKIDFSTLTSYNNIRPIDSKNIINKITDDLNAGNNIKFVSWKDFDTALETDTEFFNKVHSLATDKQIDELLRTIAFIPINENDDNRQINDDNSFFYRADRSFDNNFVRISTPNKSKGEKEKLEYQFQ